MTISTRAEAEKSDAGDPLRDLLDQFDLPDGIIYLDGNSLGPPPKAALARLRQTAEAEWRRGLIKSWNNAGWIDLPNTCGDKIAQLLGARRGEVIVCDSVSVNIFKLAAALLKTKPGAALGVERDEFPTDGYILEGLATLADAALERIEPASPETAFCSSIGIHIKSVVHYKTGAIADIAAWQNAAAQAGAAIIWDFSHATGLIDLNTARDGAVFGVGCGYKYLNGGPGAPAFVYVAQNQCDGLKQPLSGWMGHARPFDFSGAYEPAPGIARFAAGTPPILSLSALDAALDVFASIDMAAVQAKAKALGDLFLTRTNALGLKSISPGHAERRGGHVSVRFDHGYEVIQALISRGVIGDFRAPDLMRFGFSPAFLRYVDVWDAADILENILKTEEWRAPKYSERSKVT